MRFSHRTCGWKGAALVAATYIYFLIFAQFAFLARLNTLGIGGTELKDVMAAMAAGGIAFSLLMARLATRLSSGPQLRVGFSICGTAAALTLAPLSFLAALAVAFCVGAGLGVVTVALVTHLRVWTGERRPLLIVGIGTGLGYFACNIPALFTASPELQSGLAFLVCLGGAAATLGKVSSTGNSEQRTPQFPFLQILASFAVLVWLDSAAFYIIQHTPSLKAGTWMGNVHLWTNGCIHLLGAIFASLLLSRRRLSLVLCGAVFALGFACILLLRDALLLPASLFYPAGVSFYSVALVAYPAFLGNAQTAQERARQAGWLYAIAGWIGSALGIGMGQNLGHVPPAFVAISGAVVLTPVVLRAMRSRPREMVLTGAVCALAFLIFSVLLIPASPQMHSAAERGRLVYISEGCISCHSQYVRPGTADELMWGPVESMQQVHAEKPPLIGNRRQGPDLAEVGSRRSPLWLKAHMIDPAALSYKSAMPSYAFLFEDTRGSDLVAYLASLHAPDVQGHLEQENTWQPSAAALLEADKEEGATIYARSCATCHDQNGAARAEWRTDFHKLPPDQAALRSELDEYTTKRIAQIIKFGLPNTDMPGHEYFSDRQVASLTLWLTRRSAQPLPHS